MKGLRAALAGITVRLMAFNVLIVFLPIAGILSLGTYEKQLLESLEGSLVQQGRMLAAALEDAGPSLGPEASRLLRHLRQRHDARLRVVDARGRLLADSSRVAPGNVTPGPEQPRPSVEPADRSENAQESFLYRLASLPVRAWRKLLRPPFPPAEADEYYGASRVLSGPEVRDALSGRYGAATRISRGQQSVTLYSAIPILDRGSPAGAVVVSQSTYRILSDLYSLRLDIFRLFLWSVLTSLVLSFLLSVTVTVPLRRLRDRARDLIDEQGRLSEALKPLARRDEIGDLSRSLGLLTQKLARHVGLVESFASDVSHELRNPLASLRSEIELAGSGGQPDELTELLGMALADVSRMERLLRGVREISRIDSGAEDGPGSDGSATPDVRLLAERVVAALRLRGSREMSFRVEGPRVPARVHPNRLQQVLENLLDNAVSFSPPGGCVLVEVQADRGQTLLLVKDQGPGIPPEHRERIFDRFFSFRPREEKGEHAGLGLAIVRSIAEAIGGSVRAFNLPDRGACLEVRLPGYSSR